MDFPNPDPGSGFTDLVCGPRRLKHGRCPSPPPESAFASYKLRHFIVKIAKMEAPPAATKFAATVSRSSSNTGAAVTASLLANAASSSQHSTTPAAYVTSYVVCASARLRRARRQRCCATATGILQQAELVLLRMAPADAGRAFARPRSSRIVCERPMSSVTLGLAQAPKTGY